MPPYTVRLKPELYRMIADRAAEQHLPPATWMRQQLAKLIADAI